MLQLNDWVLDDIKKEMYMMNLFELQLLYTDKKKEYTKQCVLYLHTKDEDERSKIEEICELLDTEIVVIALKIANTLTGEK